MSTRRHWRSSNATPLHPPGHFGLSGIGLDAAIASDFPQAVGWKCTRASLWLNANYRVPVAHGLQGALHAPDEMLERDRYWRAVPLARQIAHKLLALEWEFRQKLGLGTIAELDA